jgi:TatD DNase family protein
MPRLIDTHCHLCHARLKGDLPTVLARAEQAGVAAIICASGNVEESRQSRTIAHQHAQVYFTAGVHPHDARKAGKAYLEEISQLTTMDKNVAVGECGLDYHYDFSPRPTQQRVFAEQADLACKLGKKLVVHTREAFDDTLAILKSSGIDGRAIVFHSFTEDRGSLTRALEIGAMISFSGIVTFARSRELREAAGLVPPDRILIETDAPYLSPEPVRKMKTNEPANVVHVAAALATVRGLALEALAELTSSNAERFFGLLPANRGG